MDNEILVEEDGMRDMADVQSVIASAALSVPVMLDIDMAGVQWQR